MRSKLSSTITSVPPAIGTASGCAALSSSASRQVSGWRISISRAPAALRRPDQAHVGVVEHHEHERHAVLDGHRDLLHQELEGVVADDPDDELVRRRELGPDARRDLPAERAGLAAADVMARLVRALELP